MKKTNVALWIVQVLLALAFGMAGFGKSTASVEELIAGGLTFVQTTGIGVVRVAGLSEVLAAVGLIFPSALRIAPKLTGWAGVGLVAVMVLAALLHLYLGEYASVIPNIVLGSLAGFVAWGRLKAVPIPSRNARDANGPSRIP